MPLDRSEGLVYLKELLSQCNGLSPTFISFETPINCNSIGLQVCIKRTIFESYKKKAKKVAQKHNLSVQEDFEGVSFSSLSYKFEL